jgi:hypothetical protein
MDHPSTRFSADRMPGKEYARLYVLTDVNIITVMFWDVTLFCNSHINIICLFSLYNELWEYFLR